MQLLILRPAIGFEGIDLGGGHAGGRQCRPLGGGQAIIGAIRNPAIGLTAPHLPVERVIDLLALFIGRNGLIGLVIRLVATQTQVIPEGSQFGLAAHVGAGDRIVVDDTAAGFDAYVASQRFG